MIVTIAFLAMLYLLLATIVLLDRLPDHHDLD